MAITNNTAITALAAKNHKYNLDSGAKPSVLSDVGAHAGLRLLAYKAKSKTESPKKTWVYRYRRKSDGAIKQMKLGSYSEAFGLKEARTEFNKCKAERDKGECPATMQKVGKAEMKQQTIEDKRSAYYVADMMEDYIVEHVEQNRIRKGITEVNRLNKKNILPTIGKHTAKNLTRAIIHNLIQDIAKTAPVISRDVRRELRAAFEHAISAGRIPETVSNPTNGVKAPTNNKGSRILDEAELVQLLKWLPTAPFSGNARDALHLTLLTGCRSGEIVSAKWKDINLAKSTYHLDATKTGTSRTVQLSKQAVEVFAARTNNGSQYVFPSPRGNQPINQSAIVLALVQKKINGTTPKDSSGIPDWSAHDLRRTTRTWLSKMRCPSDVAEAILGHAKKGILGTYDLHQYEDECKEWLQAWANKLDEMRGG
jgi:integrase